MATKMLFESDDQPAPVRPPASGLLVTNHLNLMYMLENAVDPQVRVRQNRRIVTMGEIRASVRTLP